MKIIKLKNILNVPILLLALFMLNKLEAQEASPIWKVDSVDVNGTRLFVQEAGNGEAILFIHGGPGMSHDYFLPHILPLAKHYRVILYDQRGTGKSDVITVDSNSMTVNQFVLDLEAIRKHFKLKKMNVVGHSWGGFLAASYGIKFSKHLNSLVFMDSSPLSSHLRDVMLEINKNSMTSEDKLYIRKILNSQNYKNGELSAIEKLWWATFKPSFYDPKKVYKLEFNFNSNYFFSQILLTNMYKEMQAFDLYPRLKKIKCPILVLHGKFDPMPIEASEAIRDHNKKGKIILLEKAGHFPFVEEPQQTFDIMRDFYDSLSKKK